MSKKIEDCWSGEWCKSKLADHNNIGSIELLSSNLLLVTHKNGNIFKIATMSLVKIDSVDIEGLIQDSVVDFVLNVSKEPYITQKALQRAENNNFSIGGLGDAMRALGDGTFKKYINPEISFILRGLEQHSKVTNITRLDNRRFEIERNELSSVIVLALNEYDLTADSIRVAIDKFPKFDMILKSNPNGGISKNAVSVAQSANITIYRWGELLGALNKESL